MLLSVLLRPFGFAQGPQTACGSADGNSCRPDPGLTSWAFICRASGTSHPGFPAVILGYPRKQRESGAPTIWTHQQKATTTTYPAPGRVGQRDSRLQVKVILAVFRKLRISLLWGARTRLRCNTSYLTVRSPA